MSKCAWTAVTKCRRGSSLVELYFLMVLKTGNSRLRCSDYQIPGLQTAVFLPFLGAWRKREREEEGKGGIFLFL